jgi:hypothetical protein
MSAEAAAYYSNPTLVVVPPLGGCEQIPENQFTTNVGLLYRKRLIRLKPGLQIIDVRM